VPHGNIDALAYRIDVGGRALVYAPDAGYREELPSPAVQDLYRGADALIHDCTYSPEDWQRRHARGYSSIAVAARVAARCAVRRLVMFHYDQDYTDEQVDQMLERCRALLDERGGKKIKLTAAAEGATLPV
jgi:ribonuclease BN (tRNA processing enzyme)